MITTWKLPNAKVYHGLNNALGICVHEKHYQVLPTQMVPICENLGLGPWTMIPGSLWNPDGYMLLSRVVTELEGVIGSCKELSWLKSTSLVHSPPGRAIEPLSCPTCVGSVSHPYIHGLIFTPFAVRFEKWPKSQNPIYFVFQAADIQKLHRGKECEQIIWMVLLHGRRASHVECRWKKHIVPNFFEECCMWRGRQYSRIYDSKIAADTSTYLIKMFKVVFYHSCIIGERKLHM